MKKAKTIKQEVDFLKPVIIPDVDPEDCFGNEYSFRDNDCSVCADDTMCSLVYADKLKKQIKQTEKDSGPFLDMTDFSSVDWVKIAQKAKEYADAGEPMTFAELEEAIATIARTKDSVAVIEFIKRSLPTTTINMKDGYVYAG